MEIIGRAMLVDFRRTELAQTICTCQIDVIRQKFIDYLPLQLAIGSENGGTPAT